jgi:hypothetical protein
MITSFEVGSIFRIIDEASPALRKILAQVRELRKAIDAARTDLAEFSKVVAPGISGAIKETDGLAAAWGRVSESAKAASATIVKASESARASAALATSGGTGGGGRHRPGWLGGGGAGRRGPSFHGGGGAGLAMGGLAADAIYQAAELQKEAYLAWWHSGMADTPGSQKKIRDLIQNATASTGYSFKEVGEASEDIFRLMKGVPGNGLDIAPELLRAGATESMVKGTGLKESVKSIIEMAHMMGIYDPEQLKAMAPVIGFLSTANPASLPQMGRSASYSVPVLSNALGINAAAVLFENTAIARAGATGTKSGTWVEHAFDRALPPDPHTMNAQAYSRRMWAMGKAGLVDANGKSTIMSADGKSIDVDKFLNTAREALNKLPLAMRNSVEKTVFGEQGARGFELMTAPKTMDQTRALKKEMPDFIPKYNAFLEQYGDRSTIQKARTTYGTFNNLLADIGDKVLPSVNKALGDFSGILERIRNLIPGTQPGAGATVGARGVEGVFGGALTGAAIGRLGGPIGMVAGGVIGGVGGVAAGYLEQQAEANKQKWADEAKERDKALAAAIRGLPAGQGGVFPGGTRSGDVTLNINLDGDRVATAVAKRMAAGGNHPISSGYDGTDTYSSPGP